MVELQLQPEDSWLSEVWQDLRAELDRVRGAKLMYERAVNESAFERIWDPEDIDHQVDDGRSASYWEVFLGLTAPDCQVEHEIEIVDGGGNRHCLGARGVIGCIAAVSLLAPFALVEPDCLENLEDGSMSEPSIETHVFDEEGGGPVDRWELVRSAAGGRGVRRAKALRTRVVDVLDDLGITHLSEDDAQHPVAGLRAGDDALVGEEFSGRPISVRDALFFWSF